MVRRRSGLRVGLAIVAASAAAALVAHAVTRRPWPAEPYASATLLTGLDADMETDLSGAFWNPLTRTLWVTKPGRIWALVPDGAGSFVVATRSGLRGEWTGAGDEGIAQADLSVDRVCFLDESNGRIREIDTSHWGGAASITRTWSIGANLPAYDGHQGPEGLEFVPDVWLVANGFVDGAGAPFASRRGMGGVMVVAHQNGGRLYVFDLDPAGGYDFVGAYRTGSTESSGLDFDRTTGRLWISHNTGSTNYLEVTTLASTVSGAERRVVTEAEYDAPAGTNLEGFARTPADGGDRWAFFTEDHEAGESGRERSLQWYQAFPPLPGRRASRFMPLTPCRLLDTRLASSPTLGQPLGARTALTLTLGGTCGISSGASAIAVNVTAVGATGPGQMKAWSAGLPETTTTVLSYRAGAARASNAVLALSAAGVATFLADQPAGSVHLVVDVSGEFR